MKKFLFGSIIFILVFFSNGVSQPKIGFYAGMESSKFAGDKPIEVEFEFKSGYSFGGRIDFKLNDEVSLSFQPGYLQNGANILFEVIDSSAGPYFGNTPSKEISIPLTLKYITMPTLVYIFMSKRFYATSGLIFSYVVSSHMEVNGEVVDISDYFKNYQMSALFGFGYSIPIGKNSLSFELSYAQGLTRITKSDPVEGEIPPRVRTSQFRLTTFFLIPTNKKK